jgi:hypothetical protein
MTGFKNSYISLISYAIENTAVIKWIIQIIMLLKALADNYKQGSNQTTHEFTF